MLKHAKTSAAAAPSDASLVGGPDWNADHLIDADGANLVLSSAAPATPASGRGALLGRDVAGGAMPGFVGADARMYALQPYIGQKRVSIWQPIPASTATNGTMLGLAMNFLGTGVGRSVATTNQFSMMHRTGQTSAATAGNRALAYGGNNYWRGNAANLGGFRAIFRFGISDATFVSGANMFIGFAASSGLGSGSTEPSIGTNLIGIGCDSTDTILQMYTNDGAGNATKTSLGAAFPANTTNVDAYELALYCPPNAGSIGWRVTRLNTGDTTAGTTSADLPVNTQLLLPIFMRGNMSAAAAVGIDIISMYIETDA